MKLSNINGRVDKSGRHNDRNFDVYRSSHIDADRVSQNRYWTYNGDTSRTFAEIEQEFYADHFMEHIEAQNEKERATSHYKRVKTVEQYWKGRKTRPEDKILQIGNIKDHASADDLWICAIDYQKEFNARYGSNCKILDMALHLDEATPHVHIRRVWIGHDNNGHECVGQGRALDEMEMLPPDTLAPTSRYNNTKVTFTFVDQALSRNIAREHGFEIEEPTGEKQVHLTSLQYKKQAIERDIEELERQRTVIKNDIEKDVKNAKKAIAVSQKGCEMIENLLLNPFFNGLYEAEVEEARKLKLHARFEKLMVLYYKDVLPKIQEITNSRVIKAERKYRDTKEFIKERGLEKAYRRFLNEKEKGDDDLIR